MCCRYRTVSLLLTVLLLTGCDNTPQSGPDTREPAADADEASRSPEKLAGGYDADVMAKRIAENMAKLSSEDRKLAEAQKFCPVGVEFDDNGIPVAGLLGSIDKPVKMTVKDQSVFIMCPNCVEDFKENTDEYMAVLAKIRASQQPKTRVGN